MALTAGFGYALSPDWVAYFNVFRALPTVDWSDLPRFSELVSMEKGYLSVNKILSDIGFDFGFLALLLASISLLLKTSTFYETTKNYPSHYPMPYCRCICSQAIQHK